MIKRLVLTMLSTSGIMILVAGCQTTTLTSSEKLLECETAKRVRYIPSTKAVYDSLPEADRAFLKNVLANLRAKGCL